MNKSVASRASNASSKMLEEIANRSQTKIFKVQGTFNDEQMRIIWNSLGLYVSRNLRMGRGVNVPKLGIFTFTPPEVRLKGVTNESNRDQQPRNPVFLIQKDFVKGLNLRTAIFYHQQFGAGLRPYSAIGATGEVPITKMNLIEIASYANMSKDSVELGLNRIVKYMSQKLHNGENISIQIPNLGQLICRNNMVAVRFNENIQRDTRNILSKSVDERKQKGVMSLTSDNLKRLANITQMSQRLEGKSQEFFQIDQNAKRYLQSNFNLHLDQSNMKRTVTNFDRTVATKAFNMTNSNLKDSQLYKLNKSAFFNRSNTSKQFNMALKIVREWVKDNGYNTEQGFEAFCNLISKKSKVLNENELWNVCKSISVDITQQQAQQLFRVLDNNKDGFVTIDDWRANVHFKQNNSTFKHLLSFIQQKKYSVSQIVSLLGFQGIKKVNLFTLKDGIMKVNPRISEEDALVISKHIAQGKKDIEVERIIDCFNISQGLTVEVDKEWQNSFFNRLKSRLYESGLSEEELTNKFRLYDKEDSGFIQQTDLKTVFAFIGVNLNLTELIKIIKFIPINKQNKVNYQTIIERLQLAHYQEKEEITEAQFKRIIKANVLQKFPYALPISVSKLTALLQAKYFKKHAEKDLIEYVRGIDLNSDEMVSQQDLKKYKQEAMGKAYKVLSSGEIDSLLMRFRERSIKKKISFYDIFRALDKINSGFITRESWYSNIDQVISFNQDQKENLFNFMDKNHNKMIDYKTFLSLMNGKTSINSSEQFDWAQSTIQSIKSWFRSSNLSLQDAFKILDNDGDTYINQKDLHNFLIKKLKLQERQINMVRTQKVMKLMDHYKNGRVTYLDWHKMIHQNKDWLKDVKQQIGIILSKQYSSLPDAFCQITQGQNRMVFKAFQRWTNSHHILSGFMTNQDMIKHIFSHIDHHKKGYLLQNDFIALFGSYDWKSEHTKEFIDFIALKFKSSKEAFKYFSEYSNKAINCQRFKQVGQQLFGNRFHASDLQNIWQNIAGGKESLDFTQFNKLYGDLWSDKSNEIDNEFPKDSWVYQDFSIIKGTTVRSNEHQYEEKERMESQCQRFINNLKDILASSPKTLEQVFLEIDKQKNGRVTNLMFKKAFRLLNIALTSKEIDLLLNYCSFKSQTLIDWRHFIKLLNIDEDKIKIKNRIQPKVQHLSDLLHYYMISPKDAFRKWNNPRSGYLTFEQFHKMLKELYAQASEDLPEYQQLQDLFNFIDIRKDNQIDFQQFTQVFRSCNPPNLLMGTTPAPSDQLVSSKVKNHEQNVPIRQKQIPLFRHSQQYQKFIHLLGRNRKYIQNEIEKCNSQKTAFIPFSVVQNILHGFCSGLGVQVNSVMIRNLIAFSMTGQKVDYHLLVNKLKDLDIEISEFPKKKIF